MKALVKSYLDALFLTLFKHKKNRQSIFEIVSKNNVKAAPLDNSEVPYFSVDTSNRSVTANRDDIVFITSRFRTGSTLLWNVFRRIEGCTSYYEPFNERQWFKPDLRGDGVDSTHLGVDNYWQEYVGLEHLENFYKESWIWEDLLMDESSWDPDMVSYIEALAENAPDRPVLQFNRIDFRLPWLKHNFPNAKLLHLYRHPRDQWLSFLTDKRVMNKDDVEQTYIDGFYLDSWCADLSRIFPFLSKNETPHPYARFYFLWKLSYLYGKKFSDLSICYEEFCTDPKTHLKTIEKTINLEISDVEYVCAVIEKPKLDKWKKYAPTDWFEVHEQKCEAVLDRFLKRK